MPEIIPNWHPALVHFPLALAITSTLLLLAGQLRPANPLYPASARLLLTLAALGALLAAGLGAYAYMTVDHDAAGHLVMNRHRNWALACTAGLVLLALWDGLRQRAGKAVHGGLLPAMLLLSAGLAVTGWLGAEMVYRHGVGVQPSAFAVTEVPPPPALPAAASEPPLAPGEHIHKDGQRHHH